METAIRWSPSSTTAEQRFLIADVNGRTFRHCKVQNYDGKDFRYETISTHHKVPPFRAFDWSPHDEAIVAVGQWSGEATVLRIDDQSQSLSLPIKHQRLCNAVTFSRTGLLATGLERVRNDFCLNVWDISQRLWTKSTTGSGSGSGTTRLSLDPVRKLASSEAITSIKFFPSQPDTLVCGVKGVSLRIYDTRDQTGIPSLQFHTSCVHNIAVDPLDENYFASAGPPKDTTIHVFDRRWNSSTSANLGSSSTHNGQNGPILELKKAFDHAGSSAQASVWSLRYCKGQSGCLAAIASTGDYKIFETKKEYIPEVKSTKSEYSTTSNVFSSSAQHLIIKRVHQVERAFDDKNHGRPESKRLVSFDFTNLAGRGGRPSAITVRGDQTIDIYELKGPSPALAISPKGNLAISKAVTLPDTKFSANQPPLNNLVNLVYPQEDGTVATSLKHNRARLKDVSSNGEQHSDAASAEKEHLSSREAHEALYECHSSKLMHNFEEALAFFTFARRRCVEGYAFDCKKNVDIVADNSWLQDFWNWIARAESSARDEEMVAEGIDMSYLGVYNVWNNDLGSSKSTRMLNKPGNNTDVANTIHAICDSLQLPISSPRETIYPKHRQLCLHTCGLGLSYERLEESVKNLVSQGQNTKAAALSIIHDKPKLAFLALRNGSASLAHRELSLALAGFVKGVTNDTWDDTVREIAKQLDDPYARAILALVSHGEWHDVLTETSLPLRDRVGVALMYLDDQELGQYIAEMTAESIRQGDIEGIVLTGLTEKCIPLFQAYMQKSNDLQTPVLALAHVSPRYFSSPLVAAWHETYRSTLNTYQLFLERVHFDIGATKLSTPPGFGQRPTLAPAPRQVSLRCNNCDQALDRNPDHAPPPPQQPQPAGPSTNGTAPPFNKHQSSGGGTSNSIFGDPKSGTVCPKCGRHLPRCVICMTWLGMPDPTSKGATTTTSISPSPFPSSSAGPSTATQHKDPLRDMVAVCRGCWHMSHGGHAREWFREHEVCAVPGCECRCGEVDGVGGVR